MKIHLKLNLVIIGIIIIAQFISSCKKEISNTSPFAKNNADSIKNVNAEIYSVMQQNYLWYDSIPIINSNINIDPQKLIDSLKNWRDHWSFILTQQEYQSNFVTGIYYGFGFAYSFDNNKMRIIYIFKTSALDSAGVTRGWIIKSVDGTSPDSTNVSNLFGDNELGLKKTFIFTRPNGSDTTIIFAKKAITQNTVLAYDTLHVNNKIVGYISFLEFELDADTALQKAFTYFQENNVNELVLDLRYNGGGLLSIAQNLSNMIGGNMANGKTFINLMYNDKNSKYNQTFKFLTSPYGLNLSRLFVITTGGTASASEAVINGLRGINMPVYLIGTTTDGKPVGMDQFILDYNYYLYPISFKLTNNAGYGGYYNGFTPDKVENDDITHNFGDRNEGCLAQAIYYIQNGSFSSTQKSAVTYRKIYREYEPVNFMFRTTGNSTFK
jgi:C-terminal processing protease CtpA/Prc